VFVDESAGNITSWTWDFGDDTEQVVWTVDNIGRLSHLYATAGTYTVSLQISGPGGDDTETKTDYITVGAQATAGGFPTTWVLIGVAVGLAAIGGGLFFYRRRMQ